VTKIPAWALKQKQSLPLESKVTLSQLRIRQWYEHWKGQVYVAFSGGKDSTVLLHMVRDLYPNVPAVFSDTGLEFPEIREFVKKTENVTWVKPKITFRSVIEKYGWPVVSKRVARYVRDLRRPIEKNPNTQHLRRTGLNQKGELCPSMKLAKKWLFLIDAPFLISEQCCDVMKKGPFKSYVKETGRHPMSGVMTSDARQRMRRYLDEGCNLYSGKDPISRPMSVWLEADVWEYLKVHKVPYSSIYDMGYSRTGCVFCAFGAHLEKPPNRFQLMKKTHPKLWKYCMDKLGLRPVLEHVGVPIE